jgi:hypothetical protein
MMQAWVLKNAYLWRTVDQLGREVGLVLSPAPKAVEAGPVPMDADEGMPERALEAKAVVQSPVALWGTLVLSRPT